MTASTDRTATHNGTCQACGRQHAVSPKSGKLAKHGYTVDWGFFNGTCAGSDHRPLEQDTELNVAIVAELGQRAAALDLEAEGEILKVTIQTGSKLVRGKRIGEFKLVDREEFAVHGQRLYHTNFDREVELARLGLRRQAQLFRGHAADLEALRGNRHGQPLIARPNEGPLQREYFGTYRDAVTRVLALKAEGREARQRREQWGRSYVVTYR